MRSAVPLPSGFCCCVSRAPFLQWPWSKVIWGILFTQRPSDARWSPGTSTVGQPKVRTGNGGGAVSLPRAESGLQPGAGSQEASSRLWPHPIKRGNCPEHLGLGVVRSKHFFKDGYFKNRTNKCRHVPGDQEPPLSPSVEAGVRGCPWEIFSPSFVPVASLHRENSGHCCKLVLRGKDIM